MAVLNIKRTLPAKREDVFKAWTDPIELAKWYGPEGMKNEIHEFDLRVGGKYHLTMHGPDGKDHELSGEFLEIKSPGKLVFTWQWMAGDMKQGDETKVTVEFIDQGDNTEMLFQHDGFANDQERDNHNQGWEGSFEKLDQLFS